MNPSLHAVHVLLLTALSGAIAKRTQLLFGDPPSLHRLRCRYSGFVRQLRRYYEIIFHSQANLVYPGAFLRPHVSPLLLGRVRLLPNQGGASSAGASLSRCFSID